MSRVEELALKLYTTSSCGQFGTGDYEPLEVDGESMEAFIKGYHQAEKDNELTWEDMFSIFCLVNEVLDDYAEGKTKKEVGEEVLRRFKNYKERKEK